MDETYSLILNSQNATNSNASSYIVANPPGLLNQVSYSINWDAILPRKYVKYSLRWQLQATSILTTTFEATTNGTTLTVYASTVPLAVGNGFIYNGQIFIITALKHFK